MRICYHCGRVTSGQPLFCNHCGRSYNTKLCPRLHPNPRQALACKVCGSRDLSIPQEKAPLWFKLLLFLSGIIPGISLLLFSVLYVLYFLSRLIADPNSLLLPMLAGLALGFVWLLWMFIPFALIKLLRRRRRGR
jgi:RNA polymerase subunit RPABC4/transcription elongation factor Spt4